MPRSLLPEVTVAATATAANYDFPWMVSLMVLFASVAAAYCLLKVERVRITQAALSDSSPNIPANLASAAVFRIGQQTHRNAHVVSLAYRQ